MERYADLVEAIQAEGDCTLFGYSLGGNMAFEVAKELEERGRVVPHVVIMDSYRIHESFDMAQVPMDVFERELSDHLRKHTGSEIVAKETMAQARDYIDFCSRIPNSGTVQAAVSVISDADKLGFYAAGEKGSWHGSSATRTAVLGGVGRHADMLDAGYIEHNAGLLRGVLQGEVSHVA